MNTNEVSEKPKKNNVINNVISFLKSHKRLTFAVIIILVFIVIAITVVTILHSVQAEKITQAQIGKCYIVHQGSITEVHYFQEDGCSHLFVSYEDETKQKVDYIGGSLGEIYSNYSFEISLFGTLHLDYLSYDMPVVLDEDYQIVDHSGGAWELISLEEALAFEKESHELYALTNCEPEFGAAEVTKNSTCSSSGEEKQVCNICGYEQIKQTDKLPHDYVNKTCSVCGAKKQPEKASIQANTWYIYDNSVLSVQNCLVANAVSVKQGKAMTVMYHAVCQSCHAIDDDSKLAGPEIGYDVQKIHYCDECGTATLVKLKIG